MVRAVRELPPPPNRAAPRTRPAPLGPVVEPVIRAKALPAPVLRVPGDEPLPQFTLWSDDHSDVDVTLKRPSSKPEPAVVASADADVTIPRPSRLPSFGNEEYLDWAPTLKRPGLTPSDAAAVLIAKRFRATTQLAGSEPKPPTKSDTLRPVVAASADRTEELDLDEVEELQVEIPREPAVELSSHDLTDASASMRIDLDEAFPLTDSTVEVMALQRRRRVRKIGSRLIAASVAVGVLVVGVGGVRLGARELAQSLELSSIEVTYTSPAVKTAHAASKPKPETNVATPAPTPTPAATPKATVTSTPKTMPTTPPKVAPKTTTTNKLAPPPKGKPAAKMGTLHTPAAAAGHRVYVDGFLSGFAPNPIQLKCGTHTVKVGSAAKWQTINVPCGGDAWAK